jgi:hypothetical protein
MASRPTSEIFDIRMSSGNKACEVKNDPMVAFVTVSKEKNILRFKYATGRIFAQAGKEGEDIYINFPLEGDEWKKMDMFIYPRQVTVEG